MRITAVALVLILVTLPAAAQLDARSFEIRWDWQQPTEVGRHTTLLATFDDGQVRAEHARDMAEGATYRGEASEAGRRGGAFDLIREASVAHFRGNANLNARQATVELWVRSAPETNIWADAEEHWIFNAVGYTTHGRPTYALFIRPEDNALVLMQADWWERNRKNYDLSEALIYHPGELDPDVWHHIVASWHAPTGRLWLAVNGEGVTATKHESFPEDAFTTLWLGSSGSSSEAYHPLGGSIDDLRCSDVTAQALGQAATHAAVDLELLADAEEALRAWFGFLEEVQEGGHWANCYTWPTLLPSPTGARDWIRPRGYVSNDKGHVGPTAGRMIYGAQVLEESWWLSVAREMAEAYLAAQMPQGCWSEAYFAGPDGLLRTTTYLTPVEGGKVKLQDQNHVDPMYLLVYMHRLTGDQRYLDAALDAGEFLFNAQNPNGSWSHSWDLDEEVGMQPGGNPRGGELNDLAVADGMDAMLLMYHLTEEQKYLDAFVACADWLLEAQLGPPTYGWAMSYNEDNEPIWARAWEPAAVALSGASTALRSLDDAYWVTGDPKYIEAPRKYFKWLHEAQVDGKYYTWYDAETGKPIVADHRRIYDVTDPGEMEQFRRESVRLSYAKPRGYSPGVRIQQIDAMLEADEPPAWAPQPDLAELSEGMPELAEHVRGVIERQNEDGVWVASRGQGEVRASGPVVWINGSNRVGALLQYVENARMLLGELPLEYRGKPPLEKRGDALIKCAWPYDDWYDTPLREQ
ncbi:MAG: LamG-like jellyroll fold domain-containing protein [Armatimonadota bacterium]